MPHLRLARLATSRVVLTGALTLASALGVGSLQRPTEQAVYGVSSVGGLTRLSADAIADRTKAVRVAEAENGVEAEAAGARSNADGTLQTAAQPDEASQLPWAGPRIKTAGKPPAPDTPAPEGDAEADTQSDDEAEPPEAPPEVLEAPEPPPPPPTPPPPPPPPTDSVWTSLAACESGGNWRTNTGNGYYGGLQFSLESWHGVGGQGYPHEHPPEVQIEMAERLRSLQGWNAWPVCSRRLGLT